MIQYKARNEQYPTGLRYERDDAKAQYKVIAVTTGCCADDVDPKDIENRSNELGAQGYELVEAYEAVTTGCCSRKKSSILIFQKS